MSGRLSSLRAKLVLRLRKRQEAAARQAFLLARHQVEASESHLAALQQTLDKYTSVARCAAMAGATGSDFAFYRGLVDTARDVIADRRRRLERARLQMERRRASLSIAIRRRETVGRMADRQVAVEAARSARSESEEPDRFRAAHSGAGGER